MMAVLLLLLAFLTVAIVAHRIAASPTYRLLACAFGGWAEQCRHGAELVADQPNQTR